MAFVYGDSYYGLRTWGSSNGDVKDASAALTATSSAGAVNWVVAIGAGGGNYNCYCLVLPVVVRSLYLKSLTDTHTVQVLYG